MKKNEEKKTRKYDFRKLREEVSIGLVVESDLSKTFANWLYQNTSDLEIVEMARGLFPQGSDRSRRAHTGDP